MAHGEVTIMYKTTAISTKPVPSGKFSPLSVLDRVMRNKRLHIVLYYPTLISGEAGDLTRKLMLSLSEVLSSFPMMTGRLLKNGPHEGQWMVKCNDAGLRMVEARATGSVEDWLEKVDRENELKLIHWEDMCDSDTLYYWSTFYVQLTEFEQGGYAIGLSCTHLLADPICAALFIKAWADTTLLGDKRGSSAAPVFQPLPARRPFNTNIDHKPYIELINHYKLLSEKIERTSPLQNHRAVTLAFSHEMVESCMMMTKTLSGSKGLTTLITPFQALAALFWVCISKVKGKKYGLTNMSLCLDMRKTLGLDRCFFGNCMVYNKVYDHESLLEQNEALLQIAGSAIKEVTKKMDRDGVMDLIEWLEINDRDQTLPAINDDHDHLICANLEGVESYDAILENSFKPIRASCYIEPVAGEGQVMILPSATTGESSSSSSRVVMVILGEDEVVKLLEDVFLLRFAPTIL